jgi:ferric-chelate reductase
LNPSKNRYYEFFKATQYLSIIFSLFFFFIHCGFRLSWDYFIAALSLYFSMLFYSWFKTSRNSLKARPSLALLLDSTIQITIPTKMLWQPGQHLRLFLRFSILGMHALTAHPFTIC